MKKLLQFRNIFPQPEVFNQVKFTYRYKLFRKIAQVFFLKNYIQIRLQKYFGPILLWLGSCIVCSAVCYASDAIVWLWPQ